MNNYDFYDYIRQLHLFVEAQDKKIQHLEKVILVLEKDLKELKSKPAIHVDKIEYKFDQLKVETLEGTLNIGLNPTDLEGIEDFAVDGKPLGNAPIPPGEKIQAIIRIEGPILQNLESDVSQIIQEYEKEKQVSIDENYITFIKDDIKKQLQNRIDFYFNQIPTDQRNGNLLKEQEEQIIQLIKRDIQNGVVSFLNTLPIEKKG